MRSLSIFLLCCVFVCQACSDPDTNPPAADMGPVDSGDTLRPDVQAMGDADDVGDSGATPDSAEPDAEPDAAPDTTPTPAADAGPMGDPCDQDEDGVESLACGGEDCNDSSAQAFPGGAEVCDTLDNNCDGQLNEGLDCAFYAHSPNTLFRVDPFAMTMVEIGGIPSRTVDFDTSPDGTLWAINLDSLHAYDADAMRWNSVGAVVFPEAAPNAFAINNAGVGLAVFLNHIYRIDLEDGRLELGPDIPGGFQSSGDVVVNKDNSFFMTARSQNFATDVLLLVDVETGDASVIGEVGYNGVYGLTFAWNKLFGLTVAGQLLSIDLATGAGEPLHQFQTQWYGAASTPSR